MLGFLKNCSKLNLVSKKNIKINHHSPLLSMLKIYSISKNVSKLSTNPTSATLRLYKSPQKFHTIPPFLSDMVYFKFGALFRMYAQRPLLKPYPKLNKPFIHQFTRSELVKILHTEKTNFNILIYSVLLRYFSYLITAPFELKNNLVDLTLSQSNPIVPYLRWSGRRYRKYFKKKNALRYILNCILYSFIFKDASILTTFFRNYLEAFHFKEHKRIMLFLRFISRHFLEKSLSTFGVVGYFLRLKGKISLGGSSKKKRSKIFGGAYSLSTKDLLASYSKTTVWTESGALGLYYYISYKKK